MVCHTALLVRTRSSVYGLVLACGVVLACLAPIWEISGTLAAWRSPRRSGPAPYRHANSALTRNRNGFDYPEAAAVDQYYPQFYHKTDKEGRPVYIEQLGKIDINALYKLTTQERQLKHLVDGYERFLSHYLPASSEVVGHKVETSCTILDLNNAGISTFYKVKDYVSAASTIGQNNYPETMGFMFIINAPYLFSTVWGLVKPWLDEATQRKIHILGKGYKTELLNYIDAANLPKNLGGTCECPGGCSLSDAGPWHNLVTLKNGDGAAAPAAPAA